MTHCRPLICSGREVSTGCLRHLRHAADCMRWDDWAWKYGEACGRDINRSFQNVSYLNAFLTCRKFLLLFFPTNVIEVRVTTTISARITAYSTAVGPSSEDKKLVNQLDRDGLDMFLFLECGAIDDGCVPAERHCRSCFAQRDPRYGVGPRLGRRKILWKSRL